MSLKWPTTPPFDPSRAFTDTPVRFDGPEYDPALDDRRLTKQMGRVWTVMLRGDWLTLREMASETGDPEASISAQLRHLRKARFGGYLIMKRRRGPDTQGLYEYRCVGRDDQGTCELCNGSGGLASIGPCPDCGGTGDTAPSRLF
jgi:hypothetical protein